MLSTRIYIYIYVLCVLLTSLEKKTNITKVLSGDPRNIFWVFASENIFQAFAPKNISRVFAPTKSAPRFVARPHSESVVIARVLGMSLGCPWDVLEMSLGKFSGSVSEWVSKSSSRSRSTNIYVYILYYYYLYLIYFQYILLFLYGGAPIV